MIAASDLDVAWAAGLFEGEGCFTRNFTRSKNGPRRVHLQMTLVSTDLDVLQRFARIVGGNTRPIRRPGSRFKQAWGWTAGGPKAAAICDDERFFLNLGDRRRARFTEIAAEVAANPPHIKKGSWITHCSRGHEYTEENTRWVKKSDCIAGVGRSCQTCYDEDVEKRRESSRAYGRRKRLKAASA